MSKKIIDTLMELLKEYKVEIPIIQRDYAQGRKDEHAKNVRLNLLKDMKNAVLGGNSMDLSFIYGKEENGTFIPVDGQQRLTTLFLLHLYAFRKEESKTNLFHKFTYEIRTSSRKFLEKLINHRAKIFESKIEPSAEIKDSEWFLSSWSYDPTIQSMLVMLDDIKKTFRDVDNLEDRLIASNNKPITFQFLEMKDLGMEDSLYIKLNARGKPLTEFENFKAQLIGRMKELELSYKDTFEACFDGKWTDFFWSKYKKSFDKTYYTFFGILLMNDKIIQEDKNWANVLEYKKIDENLFNAAFYTLNYVCQNSAEEEANILISKALLEERTYRDRVLLHAVTIYLLKNEGIAKKSFKEWLRIIKNLTLNTPIDNLERYYSAIENINKLVNDRDHLITFFAKKNKVPFFNKAQVKEEQVKANILLTNRSFANEIDKAEQHPYFSGQIRSALYLAEDTNGRYNEEIFKRYWTKISALFDSNKPKYGNLLRQALLTFKDYTLPVSQFKTLCVNDPSEAASTPSLKTLFSDHRDTTKQLLDKININEDIKLQLTQIVKRASIKGTDWRYCFIKYPELFKRMSSLHLRIRSLNGEMHIIQNKWSNGYNYDVFLSALCEELKHHKINAVFDNELGSYVQHHLYVKNNTITFSKEKFYINNEKGEIVFQSQSNEPIFETVDFIINKL